MIAVDIIPWGQIVNGQKQYPVHQYQRQIIDSETRFTAAIAGTGGGKTVIGPLWLAKQIQKCIAKKEKFLGMVVAPTYKVLSRATVPAIIDTFKGTNLEGIWKESRSVYVLPNDWGIIYCQGADNPGGLEGGQFHAVWGDEGGQFKLGVWTAIQGRTGAKQAPILITTTPYIRNWLYSDFHKRWQAGDKDYLVVQWSSFRNPAYPREEYERAKKSMSPERAQMRYDGSFTICEGLVYPEFPNCSVEGIEPEEVLGWESKLYGGIDYGWNDPFAALSGALDNDDILWVWYERYKSQTPIEVHAEKMPKFSDRTIKWYSEHNPEYILKLRRGGHKVLKANKNILVGIDAVNARILTGRLKILQNRCPVIFEEANIYGYPEDDEVIRGDKPISQDDHSLDALRYMIVGIDIRKAA